MQKWEYKYVITGGYKTSDEQLLNDLGDEGWELVAWNNSGIFILKRPKDEK